MFSFGFGEADVQSLVCAAPWPSLLLLWGQVKLFGKCHLCFYPSSNWLQGLGEHSGGAARASAVLLGVPALADVAFLL